MAGTLILLAVFAILGTTITLIVRGVASGKKVEQERLALREARRSQGPVEGLNLRALAPSDRLEWERLWTQYTAFYGQDLAPEVTEVTWMRIQDPSSPVKGFGAYDVSGNLLGFAHVVLHPHTWSPKSLCYLEDLFVAQPHRGRDIGFSLITYLWQLAEEKGWGRVYWHTETTNAAARRLYDRFRPADNYVRYTLTL